MAAAPRGAPAPAAPAAGSGQWLLFAGGVLIGGAAAAGAAYAFASHYVQQAAARARDPEAAAQGHDDARQRGRCGGSGGRRGAVRANTVQAASAPAAARWRAPRAPRVHPGPRAAAAAAAARPRAATAAAAAAAAASPRPSPGKARPHRRATSSSSTSRARSGSP
jgi:hypothetical protein